MLHADPAAETVLVAEEAAEIVVFAPPGILVGMELVQAEEVATEDSVVFDFQSKVFYSHLCFPTQKIQAYMYFQNTSKLQSTES